MPLDGRETASGQGLIAPRPESAPVSQTCPGCGVPYPGENRSCPRCGVQNPGMPPDVTFSMEVGRIPRPWRAVSAAVALLLSPRTSWSSIRDSGNTAHMTVYWAFWLIVGTATGAVSTWMREGGSFAVKGLTDLFVFSIAFFFLNLGVQVTVFIVVRSFCLLWWIPDFRSRAAAYAAGLMAAPVSATAVVYSLVARELDAALPNSLSLFGLVKLAWNDMIVTFLVVSPNALLLSYLLVGFYRWKGGLSTSRAFLLATVPWLLVVLVCCGIVADPVVLWHVSSP